MTAADRGHPLAGLVSLEAETLFLRLLAGGAARIGTSPSDVDTSSPGAVELLDLGLAFRSGDDDSLIRPVDQAVALQLLLERRHEELVDRQRRLLDGWGRLAALLPRDVGASSPGVLDGVTPLATFEEVVTRAAELYPSAKKHMRGTETGEFPTRPTKDRVRVPPAGAIAVGARYQMIYQVGYLATAAGAKIIKESACSGEEVRLRPEVRIKMLHVDDAVALISTDRSAHTALLIRSPAIVAMLAEWFDLLWNDSATITPGGAEDPALTETQRRILQLMISDGDAAIGRKLRLSTTTVRRHVKAIYTALGVDSRFAAGAAAVKRGWI